MSEGAGKEGPRKKRRVRAGPPVPPDSEHVSSLTHLNQAKPLEALANKEHASSPLSGNVDASHAIEGHGNNENGLSRLQTRPSPAHQFGRHRDILEEPAPTNIVPNVEAKPTLANIVSNVEASYSVGRFGNLSFTPQRGLTDSSRMDNSHECRDMMANLFTPADEEFFNEYVWDESAIRRSWKLLCQSTQQQTNTLLRFEALKAHHADLDYAHEACKDVKSRYKECRKELVCNEKSAEYKRSLGEVFCLAIGKGIMDGISIGREDADVRAILQATPNVDLASSDIFMDAYEKLFDQRYPYVDKVARMYLQDPNGLQNITPDETGPTPSGGPCDTPITSYA
uniref:Uncharacterized protein n=1 Tax=Tanacetum cinerariifolium TaxID=118510 RepID=A0A6L2NK11_TANCI|nr:hypothetical protein [Tanacetum cinerariifolium]